MDSAQLLDTLGPMALQAAEQVQQSKEKDDIRGRRIIPDYALAHTEAAQDPVVQACWQHAREIEQQIEKPTHTSGEKRGQSYTGFGNQPTRIVLRERVPHAQFSYSLSMLVP